jgi:hypothetical protein
MLDVSISESVLSQMKSKEEILDTKLCNRDYKSCPDLREPTESPGSLHDSDLPRSTTCTPEDSEDDLADKPIKIKPWSLFEIVCTFFVDNKYLFSKCIRPDRHGTAAQTQAINSRARNDIWSNLERRLDHGLVSFIIKCVHLPLNQFW